MAISKAEGQITWSAANTLSVAAASTSAASDIYTPDATAGRVFAQFKADNDGTPATGDTIDFFLLTEVGDIDATGGDDYTTQEDAHRLLLFTLIVNATDGGADPAVSPVVEIPIATSYKFQMRNNSAGRAITGSIRVLEVRA